MELHQECAMSYSTFFLVDYGIDEHPKCSVQNLNGEATRSWQTLKQMVEVVRALGTALKREKKSALSLLSLQISNRQ